MGGCVRHWGVAVDQALMLISESWSEAAETGLAISAGEDLGWIRGEVERGVSGLFRCRRGVFDDGFVVLRYEPEFKEMVLVLGEGRHFKSGYRWLKGIHVGWALRRCVHMSDAGV